MNYPQRIFQCKGRVSNQTDRALVETEYVAGGCVSEGKSSKPPNPERLNLTRGTDNGYLG